VKASSADKRTLTLVQVDGPLRGTVREFTLVKDVPVEIRGKPGKLADLAVGADVYLSLSARDWTIVRRIAEGGQREQPSAVWGAIKTVDARTKAVTVTHEEGDVTFTVPEEARVSVDGQASKLADLKTGLEVVVRRRGQTIARVEARRQ
jgi:hypothetical protein